MKKLFLLVFAFSLSAFSHAQYLLTQKYEPKDILETGHSNVVKIPYSKYTYNNGLILIVSEDKSNPLVNVNITYRIGSANDYSDRTGMAYMIYKLMDKGSRHLASGEYQNTIRSYGGKTFSQISRDRTTFSVTVPKNILSTILWMESDRQAYLLDSLTQQKFDNAKLDIIAAMYDSLYHQKYGLPDVLAQKNLYFFGHPYTWPEFGMMDHYQAFTLADLKMFYLDWYGSNNTIISITGDVNTQEVVELVNTYFGTLTKAPKSQVNMNDIFNRIAGSGGIELTEPRYISYKINVPNPLIKIVFNTVPKYSRDEKALNLIAYLLGQGKNSILYNELVRKGYAVSVNATHKTYKNNGEFSIDVLAKPDTSLALIVSKINTILSDIGHFRNMTSYTQNNNNSNNPAIFGAPLQQNLSAGQGKPEQPKIPPQPDIKPQKGVPPTPAKPNVQHTAKDKAVQQKSEDLYLNQSKSGEMIFQTISKFKINEIRQLESLQNRGLSLSDMEFYTGKPDNISPSIAEYDDISAARFYEVFNMYMLTGAKLYVSIVPKDKEYQIAARDNIIERELKSILTPTLEQNLVFRYPATEINTKKPKIADLAYNPKIAVKTDSANNGMKASVVMDNSYPLVSFNIRMDVSKLIKLMPKLDVPAMLTAKYTEWFETQSTENPLKAASFAGSSIEFINNDPYFDIHIACSQDQIMIVKESIIHFLSRPDYSLNALYSQFMQKSDDTTQNKAFRKKEYASIIKTLSGSTSVTEVSDEAVDKKTGANIKKKKLSATLFNIYSPQNMSSFTFGNIDEGIYVDYFMRLSTWQAPAFSPGGLENTSTNSDTTNPIDKKNQSDENIYFLPDDNAETATIIVEYMQLPVEATTQYYTGKLANYIFALSSVNELNKKLANRGYIRKIKGISYYRNNSECYAVELKINPENFMEAYSDLKKELEAFKNFKPDKMYFSTIKNEYLCKDIVNYETFYQKELLINNLISNKIPVEIYNEQYAKTKKLKASKVAKFWKLSYIPANARNVVIGNEAILQTQMSKTGNTIIKIDKSGTVIN